MIEKNSIILGDCIAGMREMPDDSVDFVFTDIPYGAVNRGSNGLRTIKKEYADEIGFSIDGICSEIYRISRGGALVFCGKEQFSDVFRFFEEMSGTVRCVVWQKSNPSPMNGQHIYLSGVELAVWFKKRGYKTFNAFCKNTVFKYPSGSSKIHPTQKNLELFKELILDNTNPGDLVFDPCMGSGTTAVAALETGRYFYGFELNEEAYGKCMERVNAAKEAARQYSFINYGSTD